MAQRQLTTPLIIRGLNLPDSKGEVTALQRVPYDDRAFDESRLQELLFEFPSLLPIRDIEPIFDSPRPICRELPVGSGWADLLLINSGGYITLVETKLWRNPEAKYDAVAQIVRYASDMAKWSYSELRDAVCRVRKDLKDDPLLEIVKSEEGEEFDDKSFIDNISRNLRAGRLLLLIVGDGIHAETERMTEHLQHFPTLDFAFGLVEIALFREHPGSIDPILVQPRVVAKTQVVARTVVRIDVPVKPSEMVVTSVETGPNVSATSTEEEYFENLMKATSEAIVAFVREVLAEAPNHGLRVDWKTAGPVLKYDDELTDKFFNFGQLHKSGVLWEQGRLLLRFKELGLPPEICLTYLDEVAGLVHASRKPVYQGTNSESETLLRTDSRGPEGFVPLEEFVPVKEQWLSAIDKAVDGIQKARGAK